MTTETTASEKKRQRRGFVALVMAGIALVSVSYIRVQTRAHEQQQLCERREIIIEAVADVLPYELSRSVQPLSPTLTDEVVEDFNQDLSERLHLTLDKMEPLDCE